MPVFLTVWLHFYGSYSDRACICCHLQRNETGPEVAFLLCFMESWVGVERGELGGESCSFLFSKHTANLNGWSINFSGIDLHQFCLHAHTRSHFIVNQSFWKHLTEGPVLTNKPSIPAACVAPLSGHKSAAAQTSAPFPSLSLLPHSVFYPRSVRTARRVLMSGCLAWRREERGRDSSPHHLR